MTKILQTVAVAGFFALASNAVLACDDHAMTTSDHLATATTATEKPLVVQQAAAKPVASPTVKAKAAKAVQPVAAKTVQTEKGVGSSGG